MKKRNIEEELELLSGKGIWHTKDICGLESIHLSDGPHGLRKQDEDVKQNNVSKESTCYPTASALASSWNISSVEKLAFSVAREAWNEGVSVLLGPGINIKRSPLCGRNFEYFSEDPFLTAVMGEAYVQAVQREGIAVSLKHFACNNQETKRQTQNSEVDERALREIYLYAFEYIVKNAHPASVMASYNRISGRWACENSRLLDDILRREWGFDGIVISDWGACIDLVQSVKAGMDLEMPGNSGYHISELKKALEDKTISEEDVSRAVDRVKEFVKKWAPGKREKKDTSASHRTAKEIECDSAVLLKNEGILPLKSGESVVVIGKMAEKMRFQGGGSSHINTRYKPDGVKALEEAGLKVRYAPGYNFRGEDKREEDKAVSLASEGGVVLFFGGLTDKIEGEGYDRKSFSMPSVQLKLLERICAVNRNVVFISSSGAPYDMAYEKDVRAVLQLYLGGEAVDEALADIITGKISPSGRLAETWPYRKEDTPCFRHFATGSDDVEYRESIFVGYRYYNTYNIPVRFPFGFGLSYTTFSYDNLKLEKPVYRGGKFKVELDVTNTGTMKGKDVVELYIASPPCNYIRASRELKGFCKVELERSEMRHIEMYLDERSFSIYDGDGFIIPGGKYYVEIGRSVEDIVLREEVSVEGVSYGRDDREKLSDYFKSDLKNVSKEQFAVLYNRPLSCSDIRKKGDYSRYNSLSQLSERSLLARILRRVAPPLIYSLFKDVEKDDPEVVMMLEAALNGTLESVMCQSGGVISPKVVEAVVLSANGKKLESLKKLIKG